uniref:C2H2-type domain-containing protein n=1 Tax=Poecilia formosa TaxID=48698 RepID=A0A087YS59_POEFO
MSVFIHTRGEAGGGVAAHLRCPHCGQLSKSHAQQLAHLAASHPTCLDDVAVGRLGNILMYQSSARLFHCSECFHTCKDFSKLYKHIIARHCIVEKEEEDEEKLEGPKRKRSSDEEDSPESEEEKQYVLTFDGALFHCKICGWSHRQRSVSVSHIVRKHEIPKSYASHALAKSRQLQT